MQHEQIGLYTYSINEYGCTIEHSTWRPSVLENGRCCGRKTHPYKNASSSASFRVQKDPHSCCFKCDREYDPAGNQRPNYAYRITSEGDYCRDEPKPGLKNTVNISDNKI